MVRFVFRVLGGITVDMKNFTMRIGFNVMSAAIGGLVTVNAISIFDMTMACILGFVVFSGLFGLSNLLLCIKQIRKKSD